MELYLLLNEEKKKGGKEEKNNEEKCRVGRWCDERQYGFNLRSCEVHAHINIDRYIIPGILEVLLDLEFYVKQVGRHLK